MNIKYTETQEEELREYDKLDNFDARDDFVLKFMSKHDKNKKSVVAKLSKMGIYKVRPKVSKITNEKAETKEQIVAKLARHWGYSSDELKGMDKTPKLVLIKIRDAVMK